MNDTRIIEEYAVLLSLGAVLEVAGYPKPGNVHRLRDFSDIWFEDFLVSSYIILLNNLKALKRGYNYDKENRGEIKYSIGDLIYDSLTRSMNIHGGGNTCLGIALILHPLAYTTGLLLKEGEEPKARRIATSTPKILKENTTPHDTVMFYMAVRKANPSYIRESDDTGDYPNVWDERYIDKILENDITLYEVLEYSSREDLVASEIVKGYPNVLVAKDYLKAVHERLNWNLAVVGVFLYLGSNLIDTVVSRTLGYSKAVEIRDVFSRTFKVFEEVLDRGNEYDVLWDELWGLDRQLTKMNAKLGAIADLVVATISLYAVDKRKNLIHIQ